MNLFLRFQEVCHQVLKGNIPSLKLIQLSQQDTMFVEVKHHVQHKEIHVKLMYSI